MARSTPLPSTMTCRGLHCTDSLGFAKGRGTSQTIRRKANAESAPAPDREHFLTPDRRLALQARAPLHRAKAGPSASRRGSNAFDDQGESFAAADAERGQPSAQASLREGRDE